MRSTTRRQFLATAAGVALGSSALAQTIAPPASSKKVAAIVTAYHRYSHADNIVTRFMEGFSIKGKSYPPPCKLAGLYIDQVNDIDIGRPIAKRWNIPVFGSIGEALTLGTSKLAVDGVLIVGEQGTYPTNERGQILYPRRKFFEQVVKVFRDSGRSVPVFNDKHLSYTWENAKWMYDQSRELGFPMLAGSSVPVSYRHPDLQPAKETPWEGALAVGYGHFEVYGFHTLEALQVMTERRKGGETGVKAVQCLEGAEMWRAAKEGKWDRSLLEAALEKVPGSAKGDVEEVDKEGLIYLVEYRDGLKGAAYVSPKASREFAFAGRVAGQAKPLACWYELPKPQRDHFSFLTIQAAKLILEGKADYPVERTLLTSGILDFAIRSRAENHRRIETPELDVRY